MSPILLPKPTCIPTHAEHGRTLSSSHLSLTTLLVFFLYAAVSASPVQEDRRRDASCQRTTVAILYA